MTDPIPSISRTSPIEMLNFSPRPLNVLINGGVSTVGDLLNANVGQLSNLRGMGRMNLSEVTEKRKSLLNSFPNEMSDNEKLIARCKAISILTESSLIFDREKTYVLSILFHKDESQRYHCSWFFQGKPMHYGLLKRDFP